MVSDGAGRVQVSRVLLIQQEPRAAAFLAKGLRANGFTTTVADSVDAAVAAARSGQFDLLVLDAAPPCGDGFAVLDALRWARAGVPVIVFTASEGIEPVAAALQGGADDFMTKPITFEELLARVRLRLRGARVVESTALQHGPLELDLRTRRARVGGRPVDLTAREFLLIETFVRNRDRVLSRQQLLSHVWGYGHETGSNVVDVYVCSLRRKLGPGLIGTVRGMGYRLEAAAPPRPFPRFGVASRLPPSPGVPARWPMWRW
jgi:two-component system copper resistance phosphate regulon response regulator CusR